MWQLAAEIGLSPGDAYALMDSLISEGVICLGPWDQVAVTRYGMVQLEKGLSSRDDLTGDAAA